MPDDPNLTELLKLGVNLNYREKGLSCVDGKYTVWPIPFGSMDIVKNLYEGDDLRTALIELGVIQGA